MSKSYFLVRCYQYVAFREEPQHLSTKALVKVRLPAKSYWGWQEPSLWATYPKADPVGVYPSWEGP